MFEMTTFDDVSVLHLSGEVSYPEMSQIAEMLGELLDSAKTKIVLNFQKVEHVNYKSIQSLLEEAFKLRRLEGDLKCASLSRYNKNIFRFTGADQLVESYDSVYDAVMSFHGGEEQHRTWH
jgi:anti-anti-sigma factor